MRYLLTSIALLGFYSVLLCSYLPAAYEPVLLVIFGAVTFALWALPAPVGDDHEPGDLYLAAALRKLNSGRRLTAEERRTIESYLK